MLHHERAVHRDVVLVSAVEAADSYAGPSGSPPPYGFLQVLQVLRDMVRIRVGSFGGGPDDYFHYSAADFLFVTDAHVVNLPALFEARLLPVGAGHLLKRFPTPTDFLSAQQHGEGDEGQGSPAVAEDEHAAVIAARR